MTKKKRKKESKYRQFKELFCRSKVRDERIARYEIGIQGRRFLFFFDGEYYTLMYVYRNLPIKKEKMMIEESSDMLKGQRSSALRWSWPKLREKKQFIQCNKREYLMLCADIG